VDIRTCRDETRQDNSSMENMLLTVSSAEMIAASHEAVDAIKTAAGLTDGQFAALCMPVIRTYADYVQRLPLATTAFGSPGGAWEFGLTAAMVAYRYAGTVIFFPTLGAEERRLLEPQCRYMAFVATLSTAVSMVAEASTLISGDDEYHPLCVETTLYSWLSQHPSARFSWRVPAVPLSLQASAAIAANFVPKRLLANFDLRTVLMMYEGITPKTTMNGVETTLARVVRLAVQGVLEHYKSKQAGTFVAEVSQQAMSTAEAQKVAGKLIAQANPTILVNPLEAPPAPRPLANAATATRPDEVVSASSPPTAAAASTAEPYDPAASLAAVSPPADTTHAIGVPGNDAEDKLARGHKVLREWFDALKQHPQFHVLKDQLVINDEGIEVPVSTLGMFGVSGAMIRKMMDEAGLILGRSANARGVILHPGLRDRFVAQQPK
jgi:hypothetical protein